jgi:hypothetical protein
MIPVNTTSNVAGIGSNAQTPDPLKIPDSDRKKYKKRNRQTFLQFVKRNP